MLSRWLLLALWAGGCAPDLVVDGDGGGGAAGLGGSGGDGATGGGGAGATGGGGAATGGAGGLGGEAAGGDGGMGGAGGMGGSSSTGVIAICGNGAIEAGEECDDGGLADDDACSSTCTEQRVHSLCTGFDHACALLSGGVVKCWGQNDYGQVGNGAPTSEDVGDEAGEMGGDLSPVDLGGVAATKISCGVLHTCALLDNGDVRCWGNNGVAELGAGLDNATLPFSNVPQAPVELGTGLMVADISAGSGHTCARFTNGTAKCWGFALHGQLGTDSNPNYVGSTPGQLGDDLSPVIFAGATPSVVRSGNLHTCAILGAGELRCWGYNSKGQLGLGTTDSRGDAPGEMAALGTVPLGGSATQVGAGGESVCVLLSGGSVKCWGSNTQGEAGVGNTSGDNAAIGDQPGEMAALAPVAIGAPADLLAVGINHACARLVAGGMKCWGEGVVGGLGQGSTADLGDSPTDLANAPVIDLGTSASITQIGERSFGFTCVLTDDGAVRCFGYNNHGQLGLGHNDNIGDAPGEMGANLERVRLFSDVW